MKIVFCAERDTNSKLAVLVSLYNYEKYICEALDSVAKQTLSDIELIVCNDCSTDNSAAVVLEWMQRHRQRFSRLALIENDSNSGLAATRNASVAFAVAPYVFILDADNMMYPACLERSLEILEEAASDVAFVYAQREMFNDVDIFGSSLENLEDWDPQLFSRGNYIDAMVLHKKSAIDAVGGYAADDCFGRLGWEDFELWLKYIRAGFYGVKINQPLIRYRYHEASMLRVTTNVSQNSHKLWQRLHVLYPEIIPEQIPYEPVPLPAGRSGGMIKYFYGLEGYIRSKPWLLRLARTPFAVPAKKVFRKLYHALSGKD